LPETERVDALELDPGEDNLVSAVIDPAAEYAYFGMHTNPGMVARVRLSDFERIDSITMKTGENGLFSGVMDPSGGYAYFGTNTNPGIVVRIGLKAIGLPVVYR